MNKYHSNLESFLLVSGVFITLGPVINFFSLVRSFYEFKVIEEDPSDGAKVKSHHPILAILEKERMKI